MLTVNRSPVRILLVSQNPDICGIYECLFETFGCVIAVAHSGNQALAIAETFLPHAVYMSLELGDMQGTELCVSLHNLDATRDAVLIAVTGYSHRTIATDDLTAGFDRCVTVPVSIRQLILPLAGIANITASTAVSAVVQEAQPTSESKAYTAFRNIILGQ